MSEIKVNSIKGVGASTAAITVDNTAGTCTANITNNLSNRNLIINGAMQVAQRGTSSTSESYATVDRFQFNYSGNDQLAFTQSQSTDSPDEFSSSYMVDITTAESAVDADEYFTCSQRIEAQNLQSVKTNQVTLSFHVKAYQTGTYTVSIYQGDGNRLVTATYTISSSATWEKKTITFPSNTGTQPDNNNGVGYEIAWVLAAGSNFTSSNSTSWGSYSDAGFAYGQAVNVASSTDNYWKITGVQLEVSDHATDFEHRSFGDELLRCQRYFNNVLDYNDGGHNDADNNPIPLATYYTSGSLYCHFTFPVAMRAVPTFLETSVSNHYRAYRGGGTNNFDSFNNGFFVASTKGAILEADGGISGTAGYAAFIKSANSAVKYTAFDAEL